MRYYIYIVRCEDGSFYTGITTNPHRRMREHVLCLPQGAKYTKSHPVAALCALWSAESKGLALRLEAAIKHLPAEKKRRLAAQPELLGALLSVCPDPSCYQAEPVFSLEPLLFERKAQ